MPPPHTAPIRLCRRGERPMERRFSEPPSFYLHFSIVKHCVICSVLTNFNGGGKNRGYISLSLQLFSILVILYLKYTSILNQ